MDPDKFNHFSITKENINLSKEGSDEFKHLKIAKDYFNLASAVVTRFAIIL
jgi:hypothetical protein